MGRRDDRQIRRALAGALLLATLGLLATSCDQGEGDPGDERLNALAEDPALDLVPPGTIPGEVSLDPASPDYFTKRYSGPSVFRVFTLEDGASLGTALDYFASELPDLGWVLEGRGIAPGGEFPTGNYEKDFGGWTATLQVGPSPPSLAWDISLDMEAPPAVENI